MQLRTADGGGEQSKAFVRERSPSSPPSRGRDPQSLSCVYLLQIASFDPCFPWHPQQISNGTADVQQGSQYGFVMMP